MIRLLSLVVILGLGICAKGQTFQRIYGNGQIWSPTAFAASPDAYYLFHNAGTDAGGSELIKLDMSGDTIWARWLPYEHFRIALGQEAIYLTMDMVPENILAKLDTAGNVLWSNKTSYHPQIPLRNSNSRLHVLDDGVLAVGQVYQDEDQSRLAISLSRYDSEGGLVWGKAIGNPSCGLSALASVIATNGDIVTVGARLGPPPFSDTIVIARFTDTGDQIWMRAFLDEEDMQPGEMIPTDLVTTSDGNFALLADRNSHQQAIVVKFDDVGDLIWGQRLHLADHFLMARSILEDSEHRFVIAGGEATLPTPNGLFLARLQPNGEFIDAVKVTGQGWAYGNLDPTEAYGGELVEQPGGNGYVISHCRSEDVYFSWHALTTVDNTDMPGCPELGSALPLQSSSFSWNEVPWNDLPLTTMTMTTTPSEVNSQPINEIVADQCALVTHAPVTMSPNAAFEAYPIPASDELNCEWSGPDDAGVRIEFMDVFGRIMKQVTGGSVVPGRLSIPVADLARGVYYLRMTMDGRTTLQRVVLR